MINKDKIIDRSSMTEYIVDKLNKSISALNIDRKDEDHDYGDDDYGDDMDLSYNYDDDHYDRHSAYDYYYSED